MLQLKVKNERNKFNGNANGTKISKITSIKLKKRGGKTGITEVIYSALCKLGASSVSELARAVWESDENGIATDHFKSYEVFNRFVAKTLHKLYANGKITCLKFRTVKGRIYGISTEDCWNYLFQNEIAPERLIRTFMSLIGSQCFVTNLELRELGFDSNTISTWIDGKLAKQGNYIKIHKISTDLKIYYLPRFHGQLNSYLNSDQFMEIYSKYCFKRSIAHESGKVLEQITEELYRKMGYEYRRQFPVFDYHVREDKTSEKEDRKLIAFLDGLAFKRIEDGNSPNDLIIIECKNCTRPITFLDIAHLIYIRQIKFKGRGEIHVIALNGATKSVWSNIRFYPFIRIIDWKEFKDRCEKYKPETYLKIKQQFGDFKLATAYLQKEVNGSVDSVEQPEEIKNLWKRADEL